MSSVGSEEGGEVRHRIGTVGDCGGLVVQVSESRSGVLIQNLVRQGFSCKTIALGDQLSPEKAIDSQKNLALGDIVYSAACRSQIDRDYDIQLYS